MRMKVLFSCTIFCVKIKKCRHTNSYGNGKVGICMEKTVKKYALFILASFSYAVGISLFLDPNQLAPGGIVGISVILHQFTHIPTGTLYFILNVPILILGFVKFGYKVMIDTLFMVVLNSVFTNYFTGFGAVTEEYLLAAIAGSVLVGVGIGIVFRQGATTGGIDIIVKLLRIQFPHMSTGRIFMMLDILIVTISGIVFGNFNLAMYAFIAVVFSSKTVDYILYGDDEAKLFYIISNSPKEIAERLLKEANVGVTFIQGSGGYSKTSYEVIMCVVRKRLSPKVEEIVKEEDEKAFMIVCRASEIFGEGYKKIGREHD
ncbi:MAG: YitT family protein [Lachnospiraceae bacterium]|nr:YitT family protein [Lachnospiraceae bacterium]